MHTYKDFATGKIRKTRGKFGGWTEPAGPLDVKYAIFKNRRGTVLVPVYLLTTETRQAIAQLEAGNSQVNTTSTIYVILLSQWHITQDAPDFWVDAAFYSKEAAEKYAQSLRANDYHTISIEETQIIEGKK